MHNITGYFLVFESSKTVQYSRRYRQPKTAQKSVSVFSCATRVTGPSLVEFHCRYRAPNPTFAFAFAPHDIPLPQLVKNAPQHCPGWSPSTSKVATVNCPFFSFCCQFSVRSVSFFSYFLMFPYVAWTLHLYKSRAAAHWLLPCSSHAKPRVRFLARAGFTQPFWICLNFQSIYFFALLETQIWQMIYPFWSASHALSNYELSFGFCIIKIVDKLKSGLKMNNMA